MNKNKIIMEKESTKEAYDSYMKLLDNYIEKAETIINDLSKFKEARQLSYEDWIKFQNDGKIEVINVDERACV